MASDEGKGPGGCRRSLATPEGGWWEDVEGDPAASLALTGLCSVWARVPQGGAALALGFVLSAFQAWHHRPSLFSARFHGLSCWLLPALLSTWLEILCCPRRPRSRCPRMPDFPVVTRVVSQGSAGQCPVVLGVVAGILETALLDA